MRPKEWLDPAHASLFGDTDKVEWQSAVGFFELAERAAAQRQHAAAMVINAFIDQTEGLHREALSRRLGWDGDHLGRKLRGEQWADVRDLAKWALASGDAEVLAGGQRVEQLAADLVSGGPLLPAEEGSVRPGAGQR
jgi:hypothetical protein